MKTLTLKDYKEIRTPDVKHNLNESLNRLAIGGIHRVDSKGVNIIQIVDLFIGAVVYCYKKGHHPNG